jgi:DNA polymerase-3 subunit epsilon
MEIIGTFMETIAVIDFETTGLSPNKGARATEIAVVIVQEAKIVGRYQSLMNAGVTVPSFITNLTGITNLMVRSAPSSTQVMEEVSKFLGSLPIVAHNASFDKKLFERECLLAGQTLSNQFACSMLVSRRLFRASPNHKLGTLVRALNIKKTGDFHRALSDAEMTAELLLKIREQLKEDYGIEYPTHALLRKLQKTKNADVHKTLLNFGKINKNQIQKKISITNYPSFIRSNFDHQDKTSHRQTEISKPKTRVKPASVKLEERQYPVFWIVIAAIVLFYFLSK